MEPEKDKSKEYLHDLREILEEFKVPETYDLMHDLMEWKKDL
jgi:hypothetical protein